MSGHNEEDCINCGTGIGGGDRPSDDPLSVACVKCGSAPGVACKANGVHAERRHDARRTSEATKPVACMQPCRWFAEGAPTFSAHGETVRVINTGDLNALERLLEKDRAAAGLLTFPEALARELDNPRKFVGVDRSAEATTPEATYELTPANVAAFRKRAETCTLGGVGTFDAGDILLLVSTIETLRRRERATPPAHEATVIELLDVLEEVMSVDSDMPGANDTWLRAEKLLTKHGRGG